MAKRRLQTLAPPIAPSEPKEPSEDVKVGQIRAKKKEDSGKERAEAEKAPQGGMKRKLEDAKSDSEPAQKKQKLDVKTKENKIKPEKLVEAEEKAKTSETKDEKDGEKGVKKPRRLCDSNLFITL